MSEAKRMFKNSDFNTMLQELQPGGLIRVTLTKRGDPRIYRLLIRNLYEPTEEILAEEVITK